MERKDRGDERRRVGRLDQGRIGVDRERMRDALLEARRQHEALYLVRKAVDALTTPVCPAAG